MTTIFRFPKFALDYDRIGSSLRAGLKSRAAFVALALSACACPPPPAPSSPATVESSGSAPAVADSVRTAPEAALPAHASHGAQASNAGWGHDWARGAIFYEVFVRSFADSDGDGVGDLQGLTSRLDYLNDGDPTAGADLGVDGLWLMPLFESPSYHGYDVADYERIEADYGTLEDFQQLLAEAHRRGIRIIVDLVLNHSSAQHPWFWEASAPGSARRDWYVWRADDPGWTQPWGGSSRTWHRRGGSYYYGLFWGGMPDLNFAHPPVREEMKRLAGLWLERGVDGFRLDAVRHLFARGPGEEQNDQPETHAYLVEFATHVRRVKPESLLVGEAWTETDHIASYYGSRTVAGGDELPANFNFPLAAAIVAGIKNGEAAEIAGVLTEMEQLYPPGVLDAPFLTNHDMERLATQLGGDPASLRLAASILLTLPGAPFLYYGEEVGLQNGPGREDPHKRTPMPWDASAGGGFTTAKPWFDFAPGRESANVATQAADPQSLLAHYRQLIALRHRAAALARGDLRWLPASENSGARDPALLVFLRETQSESLLIAHNLGSDARSSESLALAAPTLEPIWTSQTAEPALATRGAAGWTLTLPARSSAVFRLRR